MKTVEHQTLLTELARIAPSIALEIKWSHDDDAVWDIQDDSLDQDDFQCWQSDVEASAIVGGEFKSGMACLGGTWEKYGDHPSKSNPDIGGYLPQMAEEAFTELKSEILRSNHRPLDALVIQCELAIQHIQRACRDISTD